MTQLIFEPAEQLTPRDAWKNIAIARACLNSPYLLDNSQIHPQSSKTLAVRFRPAEIFSKIEFPFTVTPDVASFTQADCPRVYNYGFITNCLAETR
jgi:hypothetical protein